MHAGGRRFESVILHAGRGEPLRESSLTGWKEKSNTKKTKVVPPEGGASEEKQRVEIE